MANQDGGTTVVLREAAQKAVKNAQRSGESDDQTVERLVLTARDAYQRNGEMRVVTAEGKRVGVSIEQDLCTAYQSCELELPEVFKVVSLRRGEDPLGMKGVEQGKIEMESLRLAAEACPNRAIHLKDIDTGEEIPL